MVGRTEDPAIYSWSLKVAVRLCELDSSLLFSLFYASSPIIHKHQVHLLPLRLLCVRVVTFVCIETSKLVPPLGRNLPRLVIRGRTLLGISSPPPRVSVICLQTYKPTSSCDNPSACCNLQTYIFVYYKASKSSTWRHPTHRKLKTQVTSRWTTRTMPL